MWGQIWAQVKRIWGWLLVAIGALLGAAAMIADLVGRSTFIDDLTLLLQRLKPITDFFRRQPEWAFYPLCLAMLVVGLAVTATKWRVVLERVSVAESDAIAARQEAVAARIRESEALADRDTALANRAPPLPAPRAVPALPEMGLGDVSRYIASDSGWGNGRESDEYWLTSLAQEIVDRLGHGVLVAYGRLYGRYGGDRASISKLDKIDEDFWSSVELSLDRYFTFAPDSNEVSDDTIVYDDVRLFREDVERVWPRRDAFQVKRLPALDDALEQREQRLLTLRGKGAT